jgi:hypothetical protein
VPLSTTARKLKVMLVIDPAPFIALGWIADGAASRTAITVDAGGRRIAADIATKAVRKAVAAIAEHGAEGVALLLQGNLLADDVLADAGLMAQVKVPKAEPKESTMPQAP